MSTIEHRPGVHEAYLVKRRLKLKPLEAANIEAITRELDERLGVDSVSLDRASRRLAIAYDASRLGIDEVEAIIRKQGADLDAGWWARCKESWYRFTDQNVKDNARHEPWCCHKMPPKHRR